MTNIHVGNSLAVLKTLPPDHFDAIITDPPYELGFMGKKWDSSGIAYNVDLWREALRVLKPGGHLAAFGGTRTYHRMTCAIEDAGFEIRDCMQWLYGSGFPKSLDVSKAIDKAAGVEREVVGKQQITGQCLGQTKGVGLALENQVFKREWDITAPATPAAQQWQGFGTALKPANEPIVIARKPLSEKNVAANVLKWGCGAVNVDAGRIEGEDTTTRHNSSSSYMTRAIGEVQPLQESYTTGSTLGRWPANVILDEEAAHVLNTQTGADTARFFYCAKSSRKERNAGCGHMPVSDKKTLNEYANPSEGRTAPKCGSPAANHHPTVKPIALMSYLCTLLCPPNGHILDPFTGSGTTGCAAIPAGFQFTGIELNPEYAEIAQARVRYWAGEA